MISVETSEVLAELERLCGSGQLALALARAQGNELSAFECFYMALVAFAEADFEAASGWAERAVRLAPEDAVFAAAAVYLKALRRHGKQAVYVQPEAFSAFIRSGGNQRLYRATSAALRDIYAGYSNVALLDIGVGDGLALLPALSPAVGHVVALEPSRAMLEHTTRGLAAYGVRFEAVAMTIQEYVARAPAPGCDIAQATFSLQSLPPAERARVWPWLAQHARRLLLVEFDVPEHAAFSARRVAHVLDRYRRGLAEHTAEPLVVQGFLMPVMFGYFDPTAARTNHEQAPLSWVAELRAGGFSSVRTQVLDEYWWAPAVLFDAVGPGSTAD